MASTKLTTITLAELAKRVPPNQINQFETFRNKSLKYQRRASKYPDKLPPIDWDYYRKNVRADYAKLVDHFQVKYEELNHSFANRHETLDHSKYFTEWEQLTDKVQDEAKKFIEDSKDRVQIYKEEIRRIKNLKYENMTLEQFVVLREDIAHFIPGQGKPLFWPHRPDEQLEEEGNIEVTDESEKEITENQTEPKSK